MHMQNGPKSAALVWAQNGWKQIAAIAAALVLAIALLASTGAATEVAASDADSGDGTEQVVAGKWLYDSTDPSGTPTPFRTLFSRGPSWS